MDGDDQLRKNLIAILVLIGLVVYGGYDYFKKSPSETIQITKSENKQLRTGILKGQLAPDFALTDLKGTTVQLSDFKGKIVLINFWATWCPPCQVEMPHMQNIFQDFKAKDVVILGVNMTLTEENLEVVQTFVNEQQLTFPIVTDEKNEVVQTYQVVAYPTTYLLDTEGVILEKFQGAISYEIMEKYISRIH
ncbi:TlpA disulfide reductase family protein [Paenibacillus sp. IHB B 3415]|uniref:TlpA family protein disulfide reductase n=1 Tax=Paenibacillus sp. IHB B 3415 TaxID=867080 RepID=UPI000ACBA289|nr:TlpA disulfide reductase family protein [Paenibacillus sp. IHB B 3415]